MKTYCLIPSTENTFQLAESTLAREEAIHELQVLYAGISIPERKQICATHKWKPEDKIPELNTDIRIAVSALKKMVERNANNQDKTHEDLAQLCEDFSTDRKPTEPIDSSEYWYRLCAIIFKGFDLSEKEVGEINFRIVSEAYTDFFGY